MKAQVIRLVDVFVIGPMMLRAGADVSKSDLERLFWIATGIATVAYNAHNYAKAR